MLDDLAYVTARKITDRRTGSASRSPIFRGRLVRAPAKGHPMVILHDPYGQRMVTTPVERVLADADGDTYYVHTTTSLYVLRVRPTREAP